MGRSQGHQFGSPLGLVMQRTMPHTLIPPDSPPVLGGWWMLQEKYDSDPKDKKKQNSISKKFSSKTKCQNKGHPCQLPFPSPRTPARLLLWFSGSASTLDNSHKPLQQESTQGPLLTIKPTTLLFDWGQKLWLSEQRSKTGAKKTFSKSEPFLSP